MKGIILAGGLGTRLYPITQITCKQLLPIYDKPMIYYPLSTLMLSGIREILVISTPYDMPNFQKLFGDGHQLGLNISYEVQDHPHGIAEAFSIGADFIGNESICLVLGDNILYGHGLFSILRETAKMNSGATIFAYYVNNPSQYGIVEFDDKLNAISLEEKPSSPKSNYAIIGLYFYDSEVVKIARTLAPSLRGELEITDVNRVYLEKNKLNVRVLGRGVAWLDMGTHAAMTEAATFIKTVEDRQGLKIACIEEIAYNMGFIEARELRKLAQPLLKSGYGEYLLQVLERE